MRDWLDSAFGFTLADPWMLALLALLPVVLWMRRRRGRAAVAVGMGPLLRDLPGTWRTRAAAAPTVMLALGAVLAVVALARPVSRERVPLEAEGIDIVLVIDVSSSMSETDMDPSQRRSRLDVVKDTAVRFVAARPDDRIGLVVFAAFPEVRCPLTLDHKALEKFLADVKTVQPRSPEDRTGIGLGVARAARVLQASQARSRVVILMTDGQENVREIQPLDAAKLAKEFSVKIYTIAAGRGEELPFGGFQAIDTTEVKRVAELTDGKFYRAEDGGALDATYAEIDRLERSKLVDPRYRFAERFEIFLAPALALLALAFLAEAFLFREIP